MSIIFGYLSFFTHNIQTFVHDFVHSVAVWEGENKVYHSYLILSTT